MTVKTKNTMKSFNPNAWFLPQAVIVIGTYDADGTPNAMNAAWAGTWDRDEIFISMGNHQTTVNLNANPDFTVAFATRDTLVASDYVGIVSGKNVKDKVAKTGWAVEKGEKVNAPVFTDFPMTMECRMERKLDESDTGFFLIAKVINIQCDEKYLAEDGKPDVEQMNLIAYEPVHHGYLEMGKKVGNAFADGNMLKKQ